MRPVITVMGKKQNKITVDGVKYKAEPCVTPPFHNCAGCHFKTIRTCPTAVEGVTEHRAGDFVRNGTATCIGTTRLDGRNIIWVKSDE